MGQFLKSNPIGSNPIWMLKKAKTGRISSYDKEGRNKDYWIIKPGERKVLAEIDGPGMITHIWMTTGNHYREVLINIYWDHNEFPSVSVPYGDFFGLGHGIVNSYQSFFLSASTDHNNQFNKGCAMNCYFPMPFRKHCKIELVNESNEEHRQYFYIDYEKYEDESELGPEEDMGYFHAEFHRENPFGGWGHEIRVNSPEADISNKEKTAWENNYVILETKGRGHYVGCIFSVTNLQGTWWGEGDDMIWVDGYKWPPDLHGTGSEDYFNHAWGMQPNSFLRNGSSIHERNTGGYQTGYIFHIENPVRFEKEIKVTIEVGHGNHLRNEVSSVAFWYCNTPTQVRAPPPVNKRKPIKKVKGQWIIEPESMITSKEIPLNEEMKKMKRKWKAKQFPDYIDVSGRYIVNDGGVPCLKMRISRNNPNLYEIPLEELLEDFMEKKVALLFDNDKEPVIGFLHGDNDKIIIEHADGSHSELKELLNENFGKGADGIRLEVLRVLEDEKDLYDNAEYTISFEKKAGD